MNLVRAIGGAIGHGAIAGGMGAACLATGAAVLNASGHDNYYARAAAVSGVVGGAVLGGGLGFLEGLFVGPSNSKSKTSQQSVLAYVVSHAAGTVLGGMAGIGILHSAGHYTNFSLGHSAAAAATGAAIIYGGLGILYGGGNLLCGGSRTRSVAHTVPAVPQGVELV